MRLLVRELNFYTRLSHEHVDEYSYKSAFDLVDNRFSMPAKSTVIMINPGGLPFLMLHGNFIRFGPE